MKDSVAVILGLLVAWFLGYEMGKWQMSKTIRGVLSNVAKEFEEMAKKLKQPEEKSNEVTNGK